MPKITTDIASVIAAAPADRTITIFDRSGPRKVTRDFAHHCARIDPAGYTLIVRGSAIRKMIALEKPRPKWSRCFRNSGAAAYGPWPGWDTRLST